MEFRQQCSVLVACPVFGCELRWGLAVGFSVGVWSLFSCGFVAVGGVWLWRLGGCWWC